MSVNNPKISETGKAQPSLESVNREIAEAQLQKLNLEIEKLGAETNWEKISRFIPVITALISIAGFLFGIHVFNRQQELDRQTRELERQTREAERKSRDEGQYRATYEQLLQFSSNPNMTLAQASFLRQSINTLIDSLYPPDTHGEINKKEKEKWQAAIVNFINTDCDFTQTRQVKFDIAAVKWDEYHDALKAGGNDVVVGKYLRALKDLELQNPGYLKNIRAAYYEDYEQPADDLKEPYRSIFQALGCHLNLLPEEQRNKALAALQKTSNNDQLPAILPTALCR